MLYAEKLMVAIVPWRFGCLDSRFHGNDVVYNDVTYSGAGVWIHGVRRDVVCLLLVRDN